MTAEVTASSTLDSRLISVESTSISSSARFLKILAETSAPRLARKMAALRVAGQGLDVSRHRVPLPPGCSAFFFTIQARMSCAATSGSAFARPIAFCRTSSRSRLMRANSSGTPSMLASSARRVGVARSAGSAGRVPCSACNERATSSACAGAPPREASTRRWPPRRRRGPPPEDAGHGSARPPSGPGRSLLLEQRLGAIAQRGVERHFHDRDLVAPRLVEADGAHDDATDLLDLLGRAGHGLADFLLVRPRDRRVPVFSEDGHGQALDLAPAGERLRHDPRQLVAHVLGLARGGRGVAARRRAGGVAPGAAAVAGGAGRTGSASTTSRSSSRPFASLAGRLESGRTAPRCARPGRS